MSHHSWWGICAVLHYGWNFPLEDKRWNIWNSAKDERILCDYALWTWNRYVKQSEIEYMILHRKGSIFPNQQHVIKQKRGSRFLLLLGMHGQIDGLWICLQSLNFDIIWKEMQQLIHLMVHLVEMRCSEIVFLFNCFICMNMDFKCAICGNVPLSKSSRVCR